MKMIFGKRQFVLATLVFVLGGAIYLNWRFAESGNDFTAANTPTEGSNYGDTQLVNATEDKSATEETKEKENSKDTEKGTEDKKVSEKYFADTKLEKEKKRDETVETIQTSLSSKNIPNDEKAKLTEELSSVVMQTENETKMESLIKAKGFEDCVVFLDTDKANVVVKTGGLTPEQAAQIKDILLRESKVKAENIRIVEVK